MEMDQAIAKLVQLQFSVENLNRLIVNPKLLFPNKIGFPTIWYIIESSKSKTELAVGQNKKELKKKLLISNNDDI